MLQQTRAETAAPYFLRFVERFPDPAALARADEAELLGLWAGLGYYSRARRLKEAAERLVEERSGRVPSSVDELLSLPGVGPYTAGAVASIAFGRREPAVDGNVERVLVRLFAWHGPPARAPLKRRIARAARRLLPVARAGDFNQALMELGARVCLPKTPRCGECPVRAFCRAAARGEAAELPTRTERAAGVPVRLACALVQDGRRVLLVERPAGGLLAGMLDLPAAAGPDARRRLARDLGAFLGRPVALGPAAAEARHAVTRHRIRAFLHPVRDRKPDAREEGVARERPPRHPLEASPLEGRAVWLEPDAAETARLAALARKLLARR